ncbi:DUF2911 domain-containing protein [Spongiivirga sp. MCCC 1A20706]|uniref:DUF2911 domain-containing protein n=1 Tax=Spongiivirga sp. MCCC 1A20706 TaxID=3160963 RepID=UPI0039772B0E
MGKLENNIFFILLLSAISTTAQITHPKLSPFSTIKQDIGLVKITVEYSRPSARGRKIIGDLVPYDRIWRVGANESTKFTTSHSIKIGEYVLEKGTYALYTIPHKDRWEVIFHKNTTHWGDGRNDYKADEDVFRLNIQPEKVNDWQETFLIAFNHIDHNSAVMDWIWEHTKISIPIEVDTHRMMLTQIDTELKSNPTAMSYYQAARYFQEQDVNGTKALKLLAKAEKKGGKTYYIHRIRSLLLAKNGQYKSAIKEAQASLRIADSLGKDEFVRMNLKNIEFWSRQGNKKP